MTFTDKYQLLKKSVPVSAVLNPDSENCEMTDYVFQSKNCYFCFGAFRLQDSIYCTLAWGKNLVDCNFAIEAELCYECVYITKCYGSAYIFDCSNCKECYYCSLCVSCSDCFGCVGLTHKKYCIFNKQYTKEEYEKKVKELRKEDPDKILKHMIELKKTIPHPASDQYNNENCPYGDYIHNSKNSYWCFDGNRLEDCGYIFDSGPAKRSWDMYLAGDEATELNYESVHSLTTYKCAYIYNCSGCTNCSYSSDLRNCTDCFGCVGLTSKKYCILNNQLTKEKYEEALLNIKKELGWRV